MVVAASTVRVPIVSRVDTPSRILMSHEESNLFWLLGSTSGSQTRRLNPSPCRLQLGDVMPQVSQTCKLACPCHGRA